MKLLVVKAAIYF